MTGEPRYLPVLIAPELMEQWATRDTDGNRLSWSWGEPDTDGFYTPTITRHEDDNLEAEARAAALADVTAAHDRVCDCPADGTDPDCNYRIAIKELER